MELEAQRKDEERQGEEVRKSWRDVWCRRRIRDFLIWGGTVSFWGIGPKCRTVRKCCSSCSKCNPVLPYRLWKEKRATAQTSLDHFFKRVDRRKEPDLAPSLSDASEIAACPPSPVADDPSALPSPTPLPPPVSKSSRLFTGCQLLYARYCTVLLYPSRHYNIRLKALSLFLCLFIFVMYSFVWKSITNLLQYSTIQPNVLVGYLG